MAQSIEFFLHPPSPTRTSTVLPHIDTTHCTLPPVSSLLQDNSLSSPCSISSSSSFASDLPTLCLPSSPNSTSLEAVEPYSSTLNDNTPSPSLSPFMGSLSLDSPPQLSPQTSPYPAYRLLLPPPTNTRRCRSLSNASTNSNSSFSFALSLSNSDSRRLFDPPIYCTQPSEEEEEAEEAEEAETVPAPTTSPFVAKRKRGRPPNTARQATQRDSWTFVTPTVWDVKHKEEEQQQEEDQQHLNHDNNSDDYMVLHWPTATNKTQQPQKEELQGQNTFTNTKMDTTLSMPKKKRGRKPKIQLAGNFCFVWRDLTARRGANRKKAAISNNDNNSDKAAMSS